MTFPSDTSPFWLGERYDLSRFGRTELVRVADRFLRECRPVVAQRAPNESHPAHLHLARAEAYASINEVECPAVLVIGASLMALCSVTDPETARVSLREFLEHA